MKSRLNCLDRCSPHHTTLSRKTKIDVRSVQCMLLHKASTYLLLYFILIQIWNHVLISLFLSLLLVYQWGKKMEAKGSLEVSTWVEYHLTKKYQSWVSTWVFGDSVMIDCIFKIIMTALSRLWSKCICLVFINFITYHDTWLFSYCYLTFLNISLSNPVIIHEIF